MHLILYVFLIVIMSYFIMYFVSDDKNKGDQSLKGMTIDQNTIHQSANGAHNTSTAHVAKGGVGTTMTS